MAEAPVRVLLVEDDRVDRIAFERLARSESLGYELSVAASVNESLALLGRGNFDVVVTDFNLGDGTAVDVLAAAQGIPVIVTTGGGDEELAVHTMKSGACDYLAKDADRNYLKLLPAAINRAIRHHATEHRARMLSHALTVTGDAVLIVDDGNRVLFVNAAFTRTYAYSDEEILGAGAEVIGNVTAEGECWHVRKDGSRFPVLVSRSDLPEQNGVKAAVVIARDITPQKEIEHELRKARDAAEGAARAKSDFLASMSHEIRTPMNAVIGLTSVLMETPLSTEQRDFVQTIRTSGEALLSVINDILDFSKIEAGRIELEKVVFDLHDMVEQAAELLAGAADTKGVELNVHIAREVPRKVTGDPSRLRQILLNLISNAVKFTQRGDVLVEVQLEEIHGSDCVIRFAVKDTGIGIPEDLQAKLFQSFTQVDTSTTRRFGGTGLGLAISKKLVRILGGNIGVLSQAGEGSTFWFQTPLSLPPDKAELEPWTTNTLEHRRVLIVEDNTRAQAALRSLLERHGATVTCTASFVQAAAYLSEAHSRATSFHAILADYDGADSGFINQTHADERFCKVPIIAVCSISQRRRVSLTNGDAIHGIAVRPVRSGHLLDLLTGVVGEHGRLGSASTIQPTRKILGRSGPARVLVAEDNVINQKVARLMLDQLECETHIVATGREAVAALRTAAYDLVFMDCEMPEMDGFEATRQIRALGLPRVPVIALTANVLSGEREKCLAAGMDDYLSKPVDKDQLALKLWQWLSPEDSSGLAADVAGQALPSGTVAECMAQFRNIGFKDSDIRQVLQLFITTTPSLLDQLGTSLEAVDASGSVHFAHKVRGGLSSLGLHGPAEALSRVEDMCRRGEIAQAREAYASVRIICDQAFTDARSLLENELTIQC